MADATLPVGGWPLLPDAGRLPTAGGYNVTVSRNGKVLVAMSGGVDSSVAAALLKDQGYECVGVFMWVGPAGEHADFGGEPPASRSPVSGASVELDDAALPRLKRGCCSVGDACDAREVAGRLGMPFYSVDFAGEFARIIDYFVDEYAVGRTPNPCVVCNTRLKFGRLVAYADMLGAEFVATGHYARIVRDSSPVWPAGDSGARGQEDPAAQSEYRLARARHLPKDQSYVLFEIDRQVLPRCRLPVGELADKSDVRRMAADLGLAVCDKPESQEICFVPDQDYARLVRVRRPETQRAGEVRDRDGRLLGKHNGVANFTIGQRRGLGIAAGTPVYVTGLDAASNTVVIGPREDLLSAGLEARRPHWLVDPPTGRDWRPVATKIRYQHTPAGGRMRLVEAGRGQPAVEVRFDEPQTAVTPGQAAVFYAGEYVVGGGWIERGVRGEG